MTTNDDLIGYWNLNEGAGVTAADLSGYANDGTLEGTAPTWVDGINRKAVNFPGTDERVDCGNGAPLDDIGNGDFSISFWMKSKDTVPLSGGELLEKLQDGSNLIILRSDGVVNRLKFLFRKTVVFEVIFSTDSAPFDTVWHHIVITVDRITDLVCLYVDTVKDSVEGDLSSLPYDCSNTGRLSWGARQEGANPYEGLIDEPRVYNRVLTETEIGFLYAHPSGSYSEELNMITPITIELVMATPIQLELKRETPITTELVMKTKIGE